MKVCTQNPLSTLAGRVGGQIYSLSNCSYNYITEEKEEEENGTFYPDHYSGSGTDTGIKMPHSSICTLKLSWSSYPIINYLYSHMTLGKIFQLHFRGTIKEPAVVEALSH